ncbi:uncharacterized protein [Littorina saxatilis]|uniref:uncharacterized protein n=1 Tax=Littorina saxatilis TaxID=31220 RepID=UPI0038B6A06D
MESLRNIPSLRHLYIVRRDDNAWVSFKDFYQTLCDNSPAPFPVRKDNMLATFRHTKNSVCTNSQGKHLIALRAILPFFFSYADKIAFCAKLVREIEMCLLPTQDNVQCMSQTGRRRQEEPEEADSVHRESDTCISFCASNDTFHTWQIIRENHDWNNAQLATCLLKCYEKSLRSDVCAACDFPLSLLVYCSKCFHIAAKDEHSQQGSPQQPSSYRVPTHHSNQPVTSLLSTFLSSVTVKEMCEAACHDSNEKHATVADESNKLPEMESVEVDEHCERSDTMCDDCDEVCDTGGVELDMSDGESDRLPYTSNVSPRTGRAEAADLSQLGRGQPTVDYRHQKTLGLGWTEDGSRPQVTPVSTAIGFMFPASVSTANGSPRSEIPSGSSLFFKLGAACLGLEAALQSSDLESGSSGPVSSSRQLPVSSVKTERPWFDTNEQLSMPAINNQQLSSPAISSEQLFLSTITRQQLSSLAVSDQVPVASRQDSPVRPVTDTAVDVTKLQCVEEGRTGVREKVLCGTKHNIHAPAPFPTQLTHNVPGPFCAASVVSRGVEYTNVQSEAPVSSAFSGRSETSVRQSGRKDTFQQTDKHMTGMKCMDDHSTFPLRSTLSNQPKSVRKVTPRGEDCKHDEQRREETVPLMFKCFLCDSPFKSFRLMMCHLRSHPFPTAQCPVCKKKLPVAFSVSDHVCTGDDKPPFTCTVCAATLASMKNYRVHFTVHTGEKNYLCNVCGYATSRGMNFKDHLLTHSTLKPYACKQCDKSYKSLTSLRRHKRIHSGRRYVCEVCAKRFFQPSHLKLHMRIHTGEKPYQCKLCPARYNNSGSLAMHSKVHTGEKPYQCQTCGRSFALKGNLLSHRRRHNIDSQTGKA